MITDAADIITSYLRGKWVKVGRDRTYRGVDTVECKGQRFKITYTDGEVRFFSIGARIETRDEGSGLPPSR